MTYKCNPLEVTELLAPRPRDGHQTSPAHRPSRVGLSDGDTLTVKDGDLKTVLRLAEIDALERTQPYSQVSRRNLEALCRHAKQVEVAPSILTATAARSHTSV